MVPIAAAFDGGISTLGTAFAGLMLAGTAVVAIRRRLGCAPGRGRCRRAPAGRVARARRRRGRRGQVVATAAFFWLLVLAIGLARYEARREEPKSLSISFILASALLAGTAARTLLNGELAGLDREGVALLVVAATYGVLAVGWFQRDRDLSALLGALGLAAAAVSAAALLGGGTLAVAWAAQAALLAWLAYRIVEPRYGLASLAYLGLAGIHALGFDAPPRELFVAAAHPAADASVVAAVGLAALVVAYYAFRWRLARPAASELEQLVGAFGRRDGRSRWWSAPPAQRSSFTRPLSGCWRSVSPPAPSTGARSP